MVSISNISALSQQAQNSCITFIQCWTNVKNVGPTLYKWYTNVLCLLCSGLISGLSRQTQNICITFVERRHNVSDVSPTLYKCFSTSSTVWMIITRWTGLATGCWPSSGDINVQSQFRLSSSGPYQLLQTDAGQQRSTMKINHRGELKKKITNSVNKLAYRNVLKPPVAEKLT